MHLTFLIDHYFCHYNRLTEDLYLCWHYSFCKVSQQFDEAKLKLEIHSHGFSNYPRQSPKRLPFCFRDQFHFKTFQWINKFSAGMDENSLRVYTDQYDTILKAVSMRLCELTNKVNRRAYAYKLLNKLDKSHVHNYRSDKATADIKLKELFEYVLSYNFLASSTDNTGHFASKDFPHKILSPLDQNCNLSLRLFCHFYFVEKIITEFDCYEIDLLAMAEERGYNLFVFKDCCKSRGIEKRDQNEIQTKVKIEEIGSLKPPNMKDEAMNPKITKAEITKSIEKKAIKKKPAKLLKSKLTSDQAPRFNTPHSSECMIILMRYLIKSELLSPATSEELWLHWFQLNTINPAIGMYWLGNSTTLSNVIQHISGNCIKQIQTTAFPDNKYSNPTRKFYKTSNLYKEIEQIITISKQSKS